MEMSELDNRLREKALANWAEFVRLLGTDAILNAKICLLKQEGKSSGRISITLGMDREVVKKRAQKKCVCDVGENSSRQLPKTG